MLKLTKLSDFVLQLVCRESLVVKHLANLSSVEAEVGVAKVGEDDNRKEQDQVRVVQLALVFEGVVSQLVAVRNVVNVGFIFPIVASRVAAEDVDVAAQLVTHANGLTGIMVCCSDARTHSHTRSCSRSWPVAR